MDDHFSIAEKAVLIETNKYVGVISGANLCEIRKTEKKKKRKNADLPSRAEGPGFLFSSASITSSGKEEPQINSR